MLLFCLFLKLNQRSNQNTIAVSLFEFDFSYLDVLNLYSEEDRERGKKWYGEKASVQHEIHHANGVFF